MRSPAACVVLWAALAACQADDERAARATQPILDGSGDEQHQAVVAYVSQNARCSAVIFDRRGHALTAAHCTEGALGALVQGDDLENPQRIYPVTARIAHPLAAHATAFDVAILRFEGADAATPFIPLLPSVDDDYAAGELVELVGYGLTEAGPTRTRQSLVRPIHEVHATALLFDQEAGGFCTGDSGGPALSVSGPERVVAVMQSVAPDCRGTGIAGRVSALVEGFVEPVIEGKTIEPVACDACREAVAFSGSSCAGEAAACASEEGCQSLDRCSCEVCDSACWAHVSCAGVEPDEPHDPIEDAAAAERAALLRGCSWSGHSERGSWLFVLAAAVATSRRRRAGRQTR